MGKKPSVDEDLGESTGVSLCQLALDPSGRDRRGWPEALGRRYGGMFYEFYRDGRGTRFIAWGTVHSWCIVLSAESKHPAALVPDDLTGLHTDSGIGLGDSCDRVLQLLGEPSWREAFQGYDILWYLEKPECHDTEDGGLEVTGDAAAYALKEGKVVEIWLHHWETGVHG